MLCVGLGGDMIVESQIYLHDLVLRPMWGRLAGATFLEEIGET